jgi:LuxR family maltose regulon positive regulatory protein
LVSAAAGYGKSTLVSGWLDSCAIPSAWLSLDENDNDLRLFLSYLLAAIRDMFPDAVRHTLEFVNAENLPPLPVLTGSLINELDQIQQNFILALDDVHLIQERAVHCLLTEILRHPPRPLHLVLIGRQDPLLPMSSLRAQGKVTEIRVQDLMFTAEETKEYLQQMLKGRFDEATAATWAEKTEGWITGLRLAALSMRHHGDATAMLAELPAGPQYIMEFLFSEVLSHQPAGVRHCLLSTAILDRFCASLCDALCGPSVEGGIDGEEFITRLHENNLFLIPLDAEKQWFRYHHLFQRLLQRQLERRRTQEEIAALSIRACEWFEGKGLIDEAIHHSLAAGKIVSAAQIIERNRHDLLNADQWYVLERWLDRLPEEIKQQRPEILLGQAWIADHHYRQAKIPQLVATIESLLDPNSEQAVLGELNLFRGIMFYWQGQGKRSLNCIRKAQEQLPREFDFVRGEAEIISGLAQQMIGQKEMALRALHEKTLSSVKQEGIVLTRLIATICFVHLIAGELQQAAQAAERLRGVAKKSRLAYTDIWSNYLKGCCSFQTYDLDRACRYLSLVAKNKYLFHTRTAMDCLAGLAIIYQAMQRTDKSIETIKELCEFARETNDPYNLVIADSCQARVSLLRGEQESADQWLRTFSETPDAPSMIFFLEIPVITQCRVLVAIGSDASLREAATRLETLWEATKEIYNTFQMIEIGALRALALHQMGRLDEASAFLEQVVTLAAPGGWVRPFIELGPPMVDLLTRLEEQDGSPNFVRQILRAFSEQEHRAVPEVYVSQPIQQPPASPLLLEEPLTNREVEILELLAQRFQNKEIAEKLFISPETVKGHLKNIFQKLNVSKRRQAVTVARNLGILTRH